MCRDCRLGLFSLGIVSMARKQLPLLSCDSCQVQPSLPRRYFISLWQP